jgi:hypothetical protein
VIELRWAHKYVPMAYHDNGHWATARDEKILQYREPGGEWIEVPDSGQFIEPSPTPQLSPSKE